jgi:DNA-binding beta-propeller fold protein YncE
VNYTQEVVFSPSGEQLYVSRGYLGDVAVFSVRTRRLLWRVQLPGLRADHLAISRDGRRLFATSLPGTMVYAIDTRTRQIVGSYEAGDYPHVLEFAPGGRYLYSGSLGNQLAPFGQDRGVHQLTVADPRTLRVVRTYAFEAGVRPFAFTPDGQRLVLQLSYFNGFIEIDPRTGRRVMTVALPKRGPATTLQPKDYPNAAAHHGIDISHDGRTVCDVGTISNYVALVPLPAARPVRIIPVGQAPGEAITSLDGRYCFVTVRGPTGLNRKPVTNGTGDTVSVISYTRREEVKRIRVDAHPQSETTSVVPDAALRAGRFLR